MTRTGFDYMPLDRPLFPRSLAESLSELLGQHYRSAKHLARAVGIDPATAENLRKGKLGVGTLQKVMGAHGRELWERLGDEIFGETFYEFEERRIEAAIKEAEGARSNLVRLRDQAEGLLASAPRMDEAGLGPTAIQTRDGEGRTWSETDGRSARRTRGARDRGGV